MNATTTESKCCIGCGRAPRENETLNHAIHGPICDACFARSQGVRWWREMSPEARLDWCRRIGVHDRFFRNGKPPAFADDGLAEILRARPMPRGGLLAIGPIGSHKTHLLAARCVDASRRGFTARLVKWTDFTLMVRDTYRDGADQTERDIVDQFVGLDYLGLDDIGIGREGTESESSLRLAFEVFDGRYERGCMCVTDVASNMTPQEITARFDERIGRRIGEMTAVYPMLLPQA